MHVRKSRYSGTSVRGFQVKKWQMSPPVGTEMSKIILTRPAAVRSVATETTNSTLEELNTQIRQQTLSNSVRHLGMNKKGCTCLIHVLYIIQCLLRTANTHTHTHTHTQYTNINCTHLIQLVNRRASCTELV